MDDLITYITLFKMTLFGEPHGTHSEAYVMIPPDELKDGLLMLRAAGLTYDILHEDLQRYISQSYIKTC